MPASRCPLRAAVVITMALLALACRHRGGAPAPQPVTAAQLKEMTRDPAPRLILVNVWATWCGPCREEMPALVKLQHEEAAQGVKVILVSADFDVPTGKLVEFLDGNGVDFTTYLKTEKDAEFIAALEPDWSGAIPATFVYSKGQLIDFWEGKATYETFVRKVRESLAAPPVAG